MSPQATRTAPNRCVWEGTHSGLMANGNGAVKSNVGRPSVVREMCPTLDPTTALGHMNRSNRTTRACLSVVRVLDASELLEVFLLRLDVLPFVWRRGNNRSNPTEFDFSPAIDFCSSLLRCSVHSFRSHSVFCGRIGVGTRRTGTLSIGSTAATSHAHS